MRSVVLAGETMRLTEVKAVTKGYPLRGTLMDSSEPFGQGRKTNEIPASGTAWLEGRLLAALGLQVGDRFELGAASFTIDRVIVSEPDRGGQLFNIAPRVMINMDDVEATQLVLPGSRVRHRLLFAGDTGDVDAWRLSLDGQLPKNQELQGIRSARPELRRALERAEQFLGLAALVGVMLAGAAIAVSASRHARRHLDTAALMRCMGASQKCCANFRAAATGPRACLWVYRLSPGLSRTVRTLRVGRRISRQRPPHGRSDAIAGWHGHRIGNARRVWSATSCQIKRCPPCTSTTPRPQQVNHYLVGRSTPRVSSRSRLSLGGRPATGS